MSAPVFSFLFLRKLKKAFVLRESMREKKLTPLSEMRNGLVLFDASDEQNSHIMFSIIKELQDMGKNIRAVGYVPFKNNPHWCFPKISYDYLNNKNKSLSGVPRAEFVSDLLEMRFDLLIDFSQKPVPGMTYIAALSNAGLKITRNLNQDEFYFQIFDIMIDKPELNDREFFAEIKKYLQVLQQGKQ